MIGLSSLLMRVYVCLNIAVKTIYDRVDRLGKEIHVLDVFLVDVRYQLDFNRKNYRAEEYLLYTIDLRSLVSRKHSLEFFVIISELNPDRDFARIEY